MLSYRSVTSADVDGVLALWSAAGVETGAADRAEVIERLRGDDGFFIAGVDASGVVQATAMGCYDNHRGWVKRFAVAPELRRSGEGTRMLDELEGRFRAAGITKLRLSVWAGNETGGAFWESKGFEELTDIRYFVKELD